MTYLWAKYYLVHPVDITMHGWILDDLGKVLNRQLDMLNQYWIRWNGIIWDTLLTKTEYKVAPRKQKTSNQSRGCLRDCTLCLWSEETLSARQQSETPFANVYGSVDGIPVHGNRDCFTWLRYSPSHEITTSKDEAAASEPLQKPSIK